MLKELWAKMRGVGTWPEVEATVRTVGQYELPSSQPYEFPRKLAEVTFAYTDTRREHQYGSITVEHSSTLYDAKENDTFTIRVKIGRAHV